MSAGLYELSDLGAQGLQLRLAPPERGVALRLTSAGLGLLAADVELLVLPWDDSAEPGWPCCRDGRTRWGLEPFTAKNNVGLAVRLEGPLEDHATRISRALRRTLMQRVENWAASQGGVRLPVLPATVGLMAGAAEQAVLQALVRVLREHPALQSRLADPMRVSALQKDLSRPWPKAPVERTTGTRDGTDIRSAMVKLGLHHRYARPLAPVDRSALPDAVDRVVEALSASPYRVGRDTDRGQVERLVTREYFDVDPWPFTSLVTG